MCALYALFNSEQKNVLLFCSTIIRGANICNFDFYILNAYLSNFMQHPIYEKVSTFISHWIQICQLHIMQHLTVLKLKNLSEIYLLHTTAFLCCFIRHISAVDFPVTFVPPRNTVTTILAPELSRPANKYIYTQGASGGIVNILEDCNVGYSVYVVIMSIIGVNKSEESFGNGKTIIGYVRN